MPNWRRFTNVLKTLRKMSHICDSPRSGRSGCMGRWGSCAGLSAGRGQRFSRLPALS
ncbi:hypothetical protein [Caudoviricetes sp.]|nr:hypothetical protein [Caudoviricetes sp.]UOF79663.1 hypothetical protein [Caudoviricetes sp.]UOF79862.1 hypothetical protein [Bacteriophage sp.]UOF81334.1 hypothetical protein [Caudoviricetes sp.]